MRYPDHLDQLLSNKRDVNAVFQALANDPQVLTWVRHAIDKAQVAEDERVENPHLVGRRHPQPVNAYPPNGRVRLKNEFKKSLTTDDTEGTDTEGETDGDSICSSIDLFLFPISVLRAVRGQILR